MFVRVVFSLLPLFVGIAACVWENIYLALIALGLVFLPVALLPWCRAKENLWIFVYVLLFGGPVNHIFCKWMGDGMTAHLGWGMLLVWIVKIMVFICVFCIEEIVFGVVARLIWREQKEVYKSEGLEWCE